MRVASLVHFPIDQKFVLSSIRIPPQTTNLDKMLDSRTTRSATKTSCNSDFTDFQSTHKNHQRCGSHCLFCQKKQTKNSQSSSQHPSHGPAWEKATKTSKGPSSKINSFSFCTFSGILWYLATLCRYAAMPRMRSHAVARWRNHHPLGMENSPWYSDAFPVFCFWCLACCLHLTRMMRNDENRWMDAFLGLGLGVWLKSFPEHKTVKSQPKLSHSTPPLQLRGSTPQNDKGSGRIASANLFGVDGLWNSKIKPQKY